MENGRFTPEIDLLTRQKQITQILVLANELLPNESEQIIASGQNIADAADKTGLDEFEITERLTPYETRSTSFDLGDLLVNITEEKDLLEPEFAEHIVLVEVSRKHGIRKADTLSPQYTKYTVDILQRNIKMERADSNPTYIEGDFRTPHEMLQAKVAQAKQRKDDVSTQEILGLTQLNQADLSYLKLLLQQCRSIKIAKDEAEKLAKYKDLLTYFNIAIPSDPLSNNKALSEEKEDHKEDVELKRRKAGLVLGYLGLKNFVAYEEPVFLADERVILELSDHHYRLTVDEENVPIPPKPFALLYYLGMKSDTPVTYTELIEKFIPSSAPDRLAAVRALLGRTRGHLGDPHNHRATGVIRNKRNTGYYAVSSYS